MKVTIQDKDRILTPEQIMARKDLRVYEIMLIQKGSAHYDIRNKIIGSIVTLCDGTKQEGPWFIGKFRMLKSAGFISKSLICNGALLRRLTPFYLTYMIKSDDGKTYSEVWAKDMGEARRKVFDQIGDQWAFLYSADNFDYQPTRFNLRRNENFLIL